jgi:uncharacterized protein
MMPIGAPAGATVIADSGFWIALVCANDRHHAAAVRYNETQRKTTYATTWPVLTEVTHILNRRVHAQAAVDFLTVITSSQAIAVWTPDQTASARIPALMQRYLALPMDLADASLVLLADTLGHGRILTTDQRDFAGYRFKSTQPFENVLAEYS